MINNMVIIGANGSIGKEFTQVLSNNYPNSTVHAFARSNPNIKNNNIIFKSIDYLNEDSIKQCADIASEKSKIDLVIVATGILHLDNIMPEKSIKELSFTKLEKVFQINTFIPAICAKYFIPKLNSNTKSIFVSLSARVGSISDNKLGGWHSYRASKSALNMIIKSTAIETKRNTPNSIIIGLHPGTVDSNLSKPFQKNIPDDKLFTPNYAVNQMLNVINNLKASDSGKCFAWDGEEILP